MIKIDSLLERFILKTEDLAKNNGITGIKTGFLKLDELTSGLQMGELTIIAARPGMGKTAFIISMIKNMITLFEYKVVFFSLNISSDHFLRRLISIETSITSVKLSKGKLEMHEWERFNKKLNKLNHSLLFIDDASSLRIDELTKRIEYMSFWENVNIFFIDSLDLITAKKIKGEKRKTTIIRNLKELALNLDITIVLTTGVSRKAEKRTNTRPRLKDLQYFNSINCYADNIGFIYRPEYYGYNFWDDDINGNKKTCEGQGELIVVKNRNNGRLDSIRLKFKGHLSLFLDLKEEDEYFLSDKYLNDNFFDL